MTDEDVEFIPVESDYVIPDGAEWVSPPCVGAVGSPRNLDDIQAQVLENESAFRERRQARAIAIHCPFCTNYHIEMQPPVESLIGGEVTNNYIDNSPPPQQPPPVDPEALTAGINAVGPPVEEKEIDPIEEILNGPESDSNS